MSEFIFISHLPFLGTINQSIMIVYAIAYRSNPKGSLTPLFNINFTMLNIEQHVVIVKLNFIETSGNCNITLIPQSSPPSVRYHYSTQQLFINAPHANDEGVKDLLRHILVHLKNTLGDRLNIYAPMNDKYGAGKNILDCKCPPHQNAEWRWNPRMRLSLICKKCLCTTTITCNHKISYGPDGPDMTCLPDGTIE